MATKLMTITIKVEPPALGPVLIKLKEMPGIAEFHFDISDSKAGEPPAAKPAAKVEEVATALLIKGPVSTAEMMRGLVIAGHRGTKGQAFGVMHTLKKKGIAQATDEKGIIEMTAKARKSIAGHEDTALRLLPKPKAAKAANGSKGPKGKRASPGVATRAILMALAHGPIQRAAIIAQLPQLGISEKSVEGASSRARVAGLITRKDGVFSLTTKGKTELEKLTPEQVNG